MNKARHSLNFSDRKKILVMWILSAKRRFIEKLTQCECLVHLDRLRFQTVEAGEGLSTGQRSRQTPTHQQYCIYLTLRKGFAELNCDKGVCLHNPVMDTRVEKGPSSRRHHRLANAVFDINHPPKFEASAMAFCIKFNKNNKSQKFGFGAGKIISSSSLSVVTKNSSTEGWKKCTENSIAIGNYSARISNRNHANELIKIMN